MARPIPSTDLTPYLGLRARLSQVWITGGLFLFLVLARGLIAIASLNSDLASANREALQACSGVEDMGSAMASLPHYMSKGVNEITASGVEKAVNGLMSMVLLSVTAVEEIVLFVIHLLYSTYLCLITLAVRGSLETAVKVAHDVTDFLNKTLGDISNDITKDVSGFQDDVNKFIGGVTNLGGLLGSDSKPPTIDLTPSIDKLTNLRLPSDLNEGLDKLNSSMPTFDQVQNFTDNVIRFPFEELKKLINESLVGYKFDRSVFPVPQKEQLSFCSQGNGISKFFDGLMHIVAVAKKVFIVVGCILAVLVCIPMAFWEIWRWRSLNKRAQLVHQQTHDPIDVIQIASQPYRSTLGLRLASKFSSPRRQILVRWCVYYATTTLALLLLGLGLAGLLSCLFKYILLKVIEREVPILAGEVGNFTDKVVGILNNASEKWAIGANKALASTNNDINNELLGWVNTSTTAVNSTLNAFVSQTTDLLNTTFGGTVLYEPIQGVFDCLIGLKVAGIEKALTWVHDNAHVDFPSLPSDTFTLGAALSIASDNKNPAESFLADPGSETTDKITNVLKRVTSSLEGDIRTDAILSSVIIAAWVVIVLIGIIRVLISFFGRDRTRGEGGRPAYTGDNRGTLMEKGSPRSSPGRSFAEFGQPVSPIVPTQPTSMRSTGFGNEKLGWAGQRNDASVGLGHQRKSSAGLMTNDR
ncbi:hypothetical protein FGG08_001841 [Glutinoglossum americanum]|uniref:Plasma membrane fusion protein PRM1 n=1 Tax=Glutinoglossum americanum TaxID=1670608 RepID=A0A9P8L614_9PEZI|nr:hypothetical protein FGG08_001841 [Glutinoglossum americanum]